MTLPKPRFDDIRSIASRMSSKAKTWSTIGSTSPRSSQGTTDSANRRVDAIFSSSGLARSVVPMTVMPFDHQGPEVEARRRAAELSDQDQPPPSRQRGDVRPPGQGPRCGRSRHGRPDRWSGRGPPRRNPRPTCRSRRPGRGPGPFRASRRSTWRSRSTRQPIARAIWTAAEPTPPPTAWIRTRSPGLSEPWVSRASRAVMKASGTAAAASKSRSVRDRSRASVPGRRRTRRSRRRR